MKKIFAIAAAFLAIGFASAGDAPKQAPKQAPAPAKAEAKAECKGGECKTVVVARPATLRERRSLVVLQPVTVKEVKKVEVVKEVKVAECANCTSAPAGRNRLLGGRRVRTVAAGDCSCCN